MHMIWQADTRRCFFLTKLRHDVSCRLPVWVCGAVRVHGSFQLAREEMHERFFGLAVLLCCERQTRGDALPGRRLVRSDGCNRVLGTDKQTSGDFPCGDSISLDGRVPRTRVGSRSVVVFTAGAT